MRYVCVKGCSADGRRFAPGEEFGEGEVAAHFLAQATRLGAIRPTTAAATTPAAGPLPFDLLVDRVIAEIERRRAAANEPDVPPDPEPAAPAVAELDA